MLTALERNALLRYRAYREKPPTWTGIVQLALPRFVLVTVLVFVVWLAGAPVLALFLSGVVVGAAVRHASLAWQASRIMPLIVSLIDWEKADRLLEERAG